MYEICSNSEQTKKTKRDPSSNCRMSVVPMSVCTKRKCMAEVK
jgi:hypothetical protein